MVSPGKRLWYPKGYRYHSLRTAVVIHLCIFRGSAASRMRIQGFVEFIYAYLLYCDCVYAFYWVFRFNLCTSTETNWPLY
jgi:hypothetical protein